MTRVRLLCALSLLCASIVVGCGKKEEESGGGGGGGGTSDGQPMVRSRTADDKKDAARKLKQVGLAMHNFESTYGHLPVGIVAQKGQLGLSWRVAILPYIEEVDLYKQFKLNEPWDSEHNKKLISQMPKLYESPGTLISNGKTFLRTFSGPHAFIQMTPTGPKGPLLTAWSNMPPGSLARGRSIAGIPDGTSNTLMVVEAAEAVEWTKPEDIMFLDQPPGGFPTGKEKLSPLPKLGFPGDGGFHAVMCDGSVRFIKDTTDEKIIRALITASGGEVTGDY